MKIVKYVLLCVFILSVVTGCGSSVNDKNKIELSSSPEYTTYVQDRADILDAKTKEYLEKNSHELYQKQHVQITVFTIKSLNGADIKEYSNKLFRQLGIGDKDTNKGILILVAADDKKARIEVGYGLEGSLNDGKVGEILREKMFPSFKKKDYNQGIVNGYNALIEAINKEK